MYTTILLDAHNTLIEYEGVEERAVRETFRMLGIIEDELVERFCSVNTFLWKKVEMGELSKSDLEVDRFKIVLCNKNFSPKDFAKINQIYLENLKSNLVITDETFEVCTILSKKYMLVVVTNGTKRLVKKLLESKGNLTFAYTFDSNDTGYSKPNIHYFDFIFSKLNLVNKKQVLLVGDSLHADIVGGYNYGIDTCWYNPMAKINDSGIKPTYEIARIKDLLNFL